MRTTNTPQTHPAELATTQGAKHRFSVGVDCVGGMLGQCTVGAHSPYKISLTSERE
jgi:hypothetical protein